MSRMNFRWWLEFRFLEKRKYCVVLRKEVVLTERRMNSLELPCGSIRPVERSQRPGSFRAHSCQGTPAGNRGTRGEGGTDCRAIQRLAVHWDSQQEAAN